MASKSALTSFIGSMHRFWFLYPSKTEGVNEASVGHSIGDLNVCQVFGRNLEPTS